MFAPAVRPGTEACKPYIQQYSILDLIIVDEVLWTPYKTQEIRVCWVSTWHGFIAYFDYVELYMPDRVLRQFRFRQCVPAHPIQPQEARKPPNNRMYVLRNTFVEALWLEAPSHLLIESWTSVLAIPSSSCTDDYMDWFLLRSHPRIQNPSNIPRGFQVPVAPAMPPQALLDLIAREATREDVNERDSLVRLLIY
ncbi:hypothetical protein M9H77_31243 [Catharanthus roseus]|uniref:Uncharacterized protein n=1 Tax=Catharanthus roseus TaxID=4058 RepID=A0ACB9ZZW7_CATRO|nr:hypothetical protein M9H77_31243 [Catharanthus roseus]